MPKTYDNGNYKEWYFYANNNTSTNLTRKITSTKGVTDYTFDAKDRIISEVYYTYTGEYTGTLPTLTPQVKTTYTYNSYGLITNTTIRTVKYSGSTLVDTSPANIISTTTNYNVASGSRIFGSVASEVDSLGRTTRYFYDANSGRLKFVVNPDESSGVAYTYDGSGNLVLVEPVIYTNSSPAANTNAESVQYIYTQDRLTQIKTESTTYNLVYDTFGNTTSVKAGNNTLISSTYNSRNGKLATTTYGNGLVIRYVYDELDRTSEVWYTINGTQTKAYSYEYDACGNMCKFNDHVNNRVFRYKYDDQNRMTGFIESSGNTNLASTVTTYDEQSRIHTISHSQDYALTSSSANLVTKYTYNYNDKNNLSEMTLSSGSASYSFIPSYDALERVSSKTTSMTTASGTVTGTLTYGFTSSGADRSLKVSQLVSQIGSSSTTYNYIYDNNGNITKITDAGGVIQYQYQYDDLGQLTREDNRDLGYSYTYTYDNAGNRTQKKIFNFTLGTLGTATGVYEYSYSSSGWGDMLTYDGSTYSAISYDAIGNPTYIENEDDPDLYRSLKWQGRQLMSISDCSVDGCSSVSFTYNDNGIRTSKTVGGVKHTYYLCGSQILGETWKKGGAEYVLIYIYDESGAPAGLQYRTSNYASGVFDCFFFEKNLQGDIVGIYNANGKKICTYKYDAWGECTTEVVGSASSLELHLANEYNPFRYRGYYYDIETRYYYLQTRYYNPEWGRFLNADIVLDPQSIIGNNNFAYCLNNPVNMFDSNGMVALAFAGGGVIATGWAIGGSNVWNPVGWVIIGVAAVATVAVVGATIYANSSAKSSTKSSTRTKTLSDVKVKQQSGNNYQLAYISESGCLIKVGNKMNFASALAALGISGATNSVNKRFRYNRGNSSDAKRQLEHLGTGEWGIYADTQHAAKALAVVLGYSGKPEVHSSGMYGHYHDSTRTFHIWYGGTITY